MVINRLTGLIFTVVAVPSLFYIFLLQLKFNKLSEPSGLHLVDETLHNCNGSILVAHGPDPHAGLATAIYVYPINFMLLAIEKNMVLWINFKKSHNNKYYDVKYGENLFEYYFEPITPFQQCQNNNSVFTYHNLTKSQVFPEMHYSLNDSKVIHGWYYHWRHHKVAKIDYDYYYQEWYYQQRRLGYKIVSNHFTLKNEIIDEANTIWFEKFGIQKHKFIVLGIHMRGTDKGAHRRKIEPKEFYPYIKSFLSYFESRARFFIATDDQKYLQTLRQDWNEIVSDINNDDYNFSKVVFLQSNVVRSSTQTAVFKLTNVESKYQLGKQALLDILLLAKCDWFIHGASTIAEAVFYNNILLHNKSVHLEYTKNRQEPFWFHKTRKQDVNVHVQKSKVSENEKFKNCIVLHKFHKLNNEYKQRILQASNSLINCSYIVLYWIDKHEYDTSNNIDIQWLNDNLNNDNDNLQLSQDIELEKYIKTMYFVVDMKTVTKYFKKFESWLNQNHWLHHKWPWQLANVPEITWYSHHQNIFDRISERDQDEVEEQTIWVLEYDVAWKGNLQQLISNVNNDYLSCDYVGFDCFTKFKNWEHFSKHTTNYVYNTTNHEPMTCLIQMQKIKPKLLKQIMLEWLDNKITYCEIQAANLCHKQDNCKLCDFYRKNGRRKPNKNFGTFFSSTRFNSTTWNQILNDQTVTSSFWHAVK